MRGVDLRTKARNVSRQLGCHIDIEFQPDGTPFALSCTDGELNDRPFFAVIAHPRDFEKTLRCFHEAIYHARGEAKYLEQNRECALCGLKMDTYEIDHIESRGAHGRNDRMANLRAVHPDCHRERHG